MVSNLDLSVMPIVGTDIKIPIEMFSLEWCKRNHGQTPERLAERGGLDSIEAIAVLCRIDCSMVGKTKEHADEVLLLWDVDKGADRRLLLQSNRAFKAIFNDLDEGMEFRHMLY